MCKRYLFPALIAALPLAACSDSEPAPATRGERTVLVYMVAANTLGQSVTSGGVRYERADLDDIDEMIEGAATLPEGRRLLVYRDSYDGSPALYEVTASGTRQLKQYDRATGSLERERMQQAIADSRSFAPADNFGLVLWSHANGWLQDGTEFTSSPAASKQAPVKRSFGIDRGKRLNVTDLADYLRGQNLEFIYFDCCLMSSVEVAYQLRDCAPFIVASPAELPRAGMPYDLCTPLLLSGGEKGLTDCARTTFDYYAYNSDPKLRTCAMTVIRTAGLENLAKATSAIYHGAPLAHQGVTVTNYDAYGRHGNWIDFGEYATSLTSDTDLLSDFNESLGATVIYAESTPEQWASYPIYHCSGLSTYVFTTPEGFTTNGYDQLDWARDVVDITSRTH